MRKTKMFRRLISAFLCMCMVMLMAPSTVNAQSVKDTAGTSAMQYIASIGTIQRAYMIPQASDTFCYTSSSLSSSSKSNVYLPKGSGVGSYRKILGSSSKYNSVKINVKNKDYYVTAKMFLMDPGFSIYDYYVIREIPIYTAANSSLTSFEKVESNNIKTGEYLTVIGMTTSFCQVVYRDKYIFFVKKSDLYSKPYSDGTYAIASPVGDTVVDATLIHWTLTVHGSSKKNGGNICIESTNIDRYTSFWLPGKKEFKLTYNSNTGFYEIINKNSGLALDVAGGSADEGVNLQQYERNNTFAQHFQIYKKGGNARIRSQLGTYVDVSNGTAEEHQNVQLWSGNDTAAQQWYFEKLD